MAAGTPFACGSNSSPRESDCVGQPSTITGYTRRMGVRLSNGQPGSTWQRFAATRRGLWRSWGAPPNRSRPLKPASREMDPKHTPEVAGFYWRAGMAMLALENATAAAYFRRAAKLDLQGYYGGLAKQRLP
jgi:hypothetical protein